MQHTETKENVNQKWNLRFTPIEKVFQLLMEENEAANAELPHRLRVFEENAIRKTVDDKLTYDLSVLPQEKDFAFLQGQFNQLKDKPESELTSAQIFYLACWYLFIKDEDTKADILLQKAANKKHLDAMFRIALITYRTNKEEAKKLITEAANRGYAKAQWELGRGVMFETGNLRDDEESLSYLLKAAEQGYPDAKVELAEEYRYNWRYNNKISKDIKKAIEFYRQAVEGGDLNAALRLGEMYFEGDGISRDLTKAAELFQHAIKNSRPTTSLRKARAYHFLGKTYYEDKSSEKNEEKAYENFRVSFEQEHYPDSGRIIFNEAFDEFFWKPFIKLFPNYCMSICEDEKHKYGKLNSFMIYHLTIVSHLYGWKDINILRLQNAFIWFAANRPQLWAQLVYKDMTKDPDFLKKIEPLFVLTPIQSTFPTLYNSRQKVWLNLVNSIQAFIFADITNMPPPVWKIMFEYSGLDPIDTTNTLLFHDPIDNTLADLDRIDAASPLPQQPSNPKSSPCQQWTLGLWKKVEKARQFMRDHLPALHGPC